MTQLARRSEAVDPRLPLYVAAVVTAEAVLTFNVTMSLVLHACVLLAVATEQAFSRAPHQPAIVALTLVPIIRLLGAALVGPPFPYLLWYVLVGVPALVCALLVARAIGLTGAALGLARPRSLAIEAAIVACGVPAGLLGLAIPDRPLSVPGDPNLGLLALTFLPCVALLEELVFRGVLPRSIGPAHPILAIALPSLVYGSMYLGGGAASAALMAGLGAIATLASWRSGSLIGVIGAHLVFRIVLQL